MRPVCAGSRFTIPWNALRRQASARRGGKNALTELKIMFSAYDLPASASGLKQEATSGTML